MVNGGARLDRAFHAAKDDPVDDGGNLILFGASTRAAAFSALRAGLRPWCADLFADADLAACFSVQLVSANDYPGRFLNISDEAPAGPWLYTGSLENHAGVV